MGWPTPREAMIEHLAAFSSRDDRRFGAGLALPFVHLAPDGDMWRYENPRQVDLLEQYRRSGIDPTRFGRSELNDASPVLDWPHLKAFRVTFTRYAQNGAALGQSQALWVLVQEGDGWKMKLRIGAMRADELVVSA